MNEPQCLPREALKQYLAGWSDPEQSDLVESHLAECEICEQTIVALEADPDTLVEFLGHKKHAQDPARNSLIQDALAQSRELLGNQTQQDSSAIQELDDADVRAPSELGVYLLIRPLGQGGMGSVYLAKHRKLGKELAIKILPARRFRNQVFAARFQREIRAAGELEHPAIVRATDAGEEHGTHYLVMEHIDGLDLSQVSRAVGKLSIADACELIRNVALGLSHAHSQGIIHRDVKPSNLMLSKTGETKILDFGLARIGPWEGESAELTTVGQLMGTLDYMAPEQAERAEAVDYRADLYSLGATLFRLLCGRAPLAASPDLSPLAKLRLMATHEPPSLETLRPDAPSELVELVSRLLSRDPANRPASADHVAEELSRFTEGNELVKLSAKAIEFKKNRPEAEAKSHHEPKLDSQRTKSFHGRRDKRVWLSLALFPLLILAGIWITLETQKGLLVIESDAEATVKFLKDGKDYQEVEVQPGPNSTRIYAGRYEVVLAEGSDSLRLSKEQIDVTRGGTSIAKLSWEEASSSAQKSRAQDSPASKPMNEPVFRGKTLSTYLNMLSYERSSEGLGEAFVAIKALTTSENAEEVQELLLDLLPRVNGDLEVKPREDYTSSVDNQAFSLLADINTESDFRDLLLKELETASQEWRSRLVSKFSQVEPQYIGPCIDFLENEIISAGKTAKLFEVAANQLLIWYVSIENQTAIQQRLKTLLLHAKPFDRSFWLNQMQFHRHDEKHRVLSLAKQHCLETMEDEDESPQSLAQATIMLLALLDGDRISEQERASLKDAVRSRLNRMTNEELLTLTPVHANFRTQLTIPNWSIEKSGRSVPPTLYSRSGGSSTTIGTVTFRWSSLSITSLPGKLLELAKRLELDVGKIAEEWTIETNSAYQALEPVLREYRGYLEINWPSLRLFSAQGFNSRGSNSSQHAKLSLVAPETWIGYFLHVQAKRFLPVAEEEETTQSTSPAKTRSTIAEDRARAAYQGRNRTAATPRNEPLYKGRPLNEWMRILPLEKNQEGVDEALAAIQASLTEKTAPQLMQMFKRELPSVGWPRYEKYRTAFSIMRVADSDDYCKFIVEQLDDSDASDNPDTRWKNILITCSIAPESKLEEIEPIHKWIVSNGLVEDSVWFKTCSEMYRRISSDKLATQSLAEAMVQALVDCEPLRENDSFWYGSPHGSPGRSTDPSEIWMKVVGGHTMEVWADLEASKERVGIVGRFLQRFVGRMYASEQRNKGLWRKYLDFDQIEKVLLERLKKSLTDGTYLDETAIQSDNWASPRPNDCLIRFNTTAHEKHDTHNVHLNMRTLLGLLALHQNEGKADPFKRFSEDLLAKLRDSVAQLCVTVAAREKVSLLNGIRQRSGGLGAAEVLRRLTLTWPLQESELDQLGVAREQVLAAILYCSIRQGSRSHADAYIENEKLRTACEELLLVEEFSASDTDKNQELDENELTRFRLRVKGVGLDSATLDKDKDGVVTLDEIQSFSASQRAQHE